MSGHSKWSTIKRKKAANDAKRGAVFTRLAREITIAAREGGGDPDVNISLRFAIDKAKSANMPKDNIEKAIKRGTGEDKDAAELEQIMYEGYAPNGVALMIDVVTDNRNRTVAELRHVLTKSGGNLADAGSVSWQFQRVSYFYLRGDGVDSDRVFELAVDAGADDVVIDEDGIEIIAPVDSFKSVSEELKNNEFTFEQAGLRMVPNTYIQLDGEQSLKVMKIVEEVEDLEDVQEVFTNLSVTDEALELLETA
jgi:YebC/PmpR family DNA-binding regulatory protein